MAISPNSFFNTDASAILASNQAQDRADARLSDNFQILGSTIIRLTSELGNISKFIITGQKQENKILDDFVKESEIKSRLTRTGISGPEKMSISDVSSSITSSAGMVGNMPSMAIFGAGIAAGGLGALISSFFQGGGIPDGSPGDTSGDLSGSQNSQKAFNYFVSRGYSKEQSAALVGNFLQENSTLNPSTTNSIGHKGIAQWDPKNRYPGLVKFSESKGMKPDTLEAQLQYVEHELTTGSGGLSKSRLQGTKGLEESTKLVRTQYLRPGEHEAMDENRLRNAQDVLKRYGGSQSAKPSGTSTSKASTITGAPGSSRVSGSSEMSHEAMQIKVGDTSQARSMASSQVASSIVPKTQSESPMIAVIPSSATSPRPIVSPARESKSSSGSPSSDHWLSDISRLNMGIATMG